MDNTIAKTLKAVAFYILILGLSNAIFFAIQLASPIRVDPNESMQAQCEYSTYTLLPFPVKVHHKCVQKITEAGTFKTYEPEFIIWGIMMHIPLLASFILLDRFTRIGLKTLLFAYALVNLGIFASFGVYFRQ